MIGVRRKRPIGPFLARIFFVQAILKLLTLLEGWAIHWVERKYAHYTTYNTTVLYHKFVLANFALVPTWLGGSLSALTVFSPAAAAHGPGARGPPRGQHALHRRRQARAYRLRVGVSRGQLQAGVTLV
eukprot:8774889-Pyramimonas_sp.AAC.1